MKITVHRGGASKIQLPVRALVVWINLTPRPLRAILKIVRNVFTY